MSAQQDAYRDAAAILATAVAARDEKTVEQAARDAWTPTGPSLADLEARIRAQRDTVARAS